MAGASKDKGLPIQEDLLSTYSKFLLNDNLRGVLEQYSRDFLNINFNNIDNVKFPTFKETLGILDLAIEKEETFGPNNPLIKLRKLRNYLVISMGIAIENYNLT